MLWMQIEVESILKHLAGYHKLVEATIAKDMTDKAENLFQSEDEYDPALFEVELDETKWIYESYFPRFLRYSLIVTIVMILETTCRIMRYYQEQKWLVGQSKRFERGYIESVQKIS